MIIVEINLEDDELVKPRALSNNSRYPLFDHINTKLRLRFDRNFLNQGKVA